MQVVDEVGNAATLGAPELVFDVDRQPPAAPSVTRPREKQQHTVTGRVEGAV